MPLIYKCHLCGGTFQSDWSEGEARAEQDAMFPGLPLERQAVVCDPCYKLIMATEDTVQPDAALWRKRRRERAS